jgi:uncharacterized protein YbbC (DUF1343 family)
VDIEFMTAGTTRSLKRSGPSATGVTGVFQYLEEHVRTGTTNGTAFDLRSQMAHRRKSTRSVAALLTVALLAGGCASSGRGEPEIGPDGRPIPGTVARFKSGLTVLLDDSLRIIANKRVGIITNHTGIDEKRRRNIDLLTTDKRSIDAGVKLVRIFSPEHGIRGTEDKPNVADDRDEKTGLPIFSLYRSGTISPPDSTLKDIDVLLIDLQDIGTRTWTYVGVMLYAMQAGARNNVQVVVLDRPNPISGSRTEGALLDTALANPAEPTGGKGGNGFALWPIPLRHGLTMGELARYFHAQMKLGTRLTIVPMRGWRRDMWFDETTLPWVRPSPNMPSLASAVMYPALVPFERTNVSVGRGTNEPFQRFGAPWLKSDSVARMLDDLSLSGVRFRAERFTPSDPTDGKYAGRSIPGVRIEITDRTEAQPSRIGAAVLWALLRMHRDSLTIEARGIDERMGSTQMREALQQGADPDAIMDRQLPAVVAFEREARRFHLYH